mgnify:CR=1 FL=1|jgi:hypothetical protein
MSAFPRKHLDYLVATVFVGAERYKLRDSLISNQIIAGLLHQNCLYNPQEPGQFYWQERAERRKLLALRVAPDELLLLHDINKEALLTVASFVY